MTAAVALELDAVGFGYGRDAVLHDADLRVREGELVAVVGANGAGKTTMLKLALGLLAPTSGVVRLFGTPVASFRDWQRVGYVPQRAAAASVLPVSVDEVVRSGLAGALGLWRRPDAAQRARIAHVLDLLGLAAVRAAPVATLSGGQQQRALIARALVTAPRLLVLDEPTTGVDAAARATLRASLEHLVHDEHVAVVYSSHDPHALRGLADRVVEVRDGGLHDVAPAAAPAPGGGR